MRMPQCGKGLYNAITLKNFPWNQLFSNFFSKNVDLTEKCDHIFEDFSTQVHA